MKVLSVAVACMALSQQAAAAPVEDDFMDDLEMFAMMASPTPVQSDLFVMAPVQVGASGPAAPTVGSAKPGAANVPNVQSAPAGAPKPAGAMADSPMGAAPGAVASPSCPYGCGIFSQCTGRGCVCLQGYEYFDKNNPHYGCKAITTPAVTKMRQQGTNSCLNYNLQMVDCGTAPGYTFNDNKVKTPDNRCLGLKNDGDQQVVLSPCGGRNQDWMYQDGLIILGGTQCLTAASPLFAGSCYGDGNQKWEFKA